MTQAATHDHFFHGQVVLHQPRDGYRFSIDAVLLSHLAAPADGERVLDLGTGCGVIPILLAFRHATIHVQAVELQPPLAAFARRNVADNGMDDRIRIVEKDMVDLSLADIGGPVDLVVSNPPYRKLNSGRLSADSQRAVARHELRIDLPALLHTSRRLLRKMGRLAIIYPVVRAVDLLSAMRGEGLEPKSLTMIHANATSPAQLVAVVGVHGGRPGLAVSPPIPVYDNDGRYTPAVAAMFDG